MVRQKHPPRLFDSCHIWLTKHLGEKVVKAGYDNTSNNNQTLSAVRLKLRPFFIEHIPAVLRTTLLEETGDFLYRKSLSSGVDCDYGRSVLYLLYLLLNKEVKRLKVTLCCYYGCRDMEGVLRCIKKNGSSLEHLELSRTSLLRMDPFLFRNVLTSATKLTSLVVKNICSDAMLKLIGNHCFCLQYLDISNSKQVSDSGIESLCCQVQIRDKRDLVGDDFTQQNVPFREFDHNQQHSNNINVQEDFGHVNSGCVSGNRTFTWRNFRQKVRRCLTPSRNRSHVDERRGYLVGEEPDECLVEIKQVLHPVCATLKVFDITDTSVTNSGLLLILKRISHLNSLGDYSISENFLSTILPSLVNTMKFGLMSANTRKVSNSGIKNLVQVLPDLRALTCWEPLFDITDLSRLPNLRQLILLRVPFQLNVMRQIMSFVENPKLAGEMEKICFEFILHEEVYVHPNYHRGGNHEMLEFDIAKVFEKCQKLKIFLVEFKESAMLTPAIFYSADKNANNRSFGQSLVHVQLGQIVRNSAIEALMLNCPQLKHLHCNNCPDLNDEDLQTFALRSVNSELKCFYIYEAPNLSYLSFQTLIDCFPRLEKFGNLTRWAVNCEGIQQVIRTIRDNNLDVEVLCGSHWFASSCSWTVRLPSNKYF